MSQKRRVVISGIGLVSSCGNGWEPYWQAVCNARSSITNITLFNTNDLPSKFAGEIPNFDPKEFIRREFVQRRKSLKVMSREIQMAVAASQLAIDDTKFAEANYDNSRVGVTLGTGIINNDLDEMGMGIKNSLDENGEFSIDKFGEDGMHSLYPLWMLKYLPNMPACHVSITHHLRGPSNTITTSSAASTQAIGEAYRVIERGDAEMMLTGGSDSKINAMGMSRFHLLNLLSQRNGDPEKAYCPFDKNHDGIVLGEGAGIIVLETLESAKKRNAPIYGEVIGYGSSSDFNYDPRDTDDFTGKRVAIKRALEDASLDPKDLDVVFANGSGIPQEDIQETLAIQSFYPSSFQKMQVTAVKPITGHLIYGSGGVEIVAATLSLRDGIIPAVANLKSPDPNCELPFVQKKAQKRNIKIALLNTFGFGGQNASLVLQKC